MMERSLLLDSVTGASSIFKQKKKLKKKTQKKKP